MCAKGDAVSDVGVAAGEENGRRGGTLRAAGARRSNARNIEQARGNAKRKGGECRWSEHDNTVFVSVRLFRSLFNSVVKCSQGGLWKRQSLEVDGVDSWHTIR